MDNLEQKKEPEFLNYVYQLNDGRSLSEAFQLSIEDIDNLNVSQLKRIGLKTYAKDKWTIHKIFQHLIDWERIWCFRAIIFARNEGTIPVAHDQEVMADNSSADQRSIDELIAELRAVRQSTQYLFNSFSDDMLATTCAFFEYQMPLRAIGLTTTAHQIHHFKVINERYIPLGS